MAAEDRLVDHAAREVVAAAAIRQNLKGIDLAHFLLTALSVEHKVAKLVGSTDECQFKILGYDVGVQGGTPHFPDACRVDVVGEHEYAFLAGRRLMVDLLMDPASILPPPEGPNPIWRAVQIEKFVSRVRELGLSAPPANEDRLGESGDLAISHGEAMTDVRGGESKKWSVARFRVVHRGLVYRCRFVRTTKDEYGIGYEEPDVIECDPRFATAPSGSVRYIAPKPALWGRRGASSPKHVVTPFGHTVDHVRYGDMGFRIQTPYDLLAAIKRYSAAWKAGPQKSPETFMALVELLGMRGWFERYGQTHAWRCTRERHDSSVDVFFHKQEDGTLKAKLQFSFAESTIGCRPVWIRTPRRFYEVIRDTYWGGPDGRKRYKPGDVAPWVAAMREDRPEDDGIG